MTLIALILLIGTVLLGASLAGGWWWVSRPPALRSRVVVNFVRDADDDEVAIRGVLWRCRGPWLVLTDCEMLQRGQQPTPMDGATVVHRGQVRFLQRLDGDRELT